MSLTKPFADYAHIRRHGPFVFLAGQGCRDPESNAYPGTEISADGRVISYDMTAQTKGVLENVERALASAGLARRDLLDVTVFLTNMDDFEAMNAVWNAWFQDLAPPTRTTVAVAKLPGHNQVEMKAIAASERMSL